MKGISGKQGTDLKCVKEIDTIKLQRYSFSKRAKRAIFFVRPLKYEEKREIRRISSKNV